MNSKLSSVAEYTGAVREGIHVTAWVTWRAHILGILTGQERWRIKEKE